MNQTTLIKFKDNAIYPPKGSIDHHILGILQNREGDIVLKIYLVNSIPRYSDIKASISRLRAKGWNIKHNHRGGRFSGWGLNVDLREIMRES